MSKRRQHGLEVRPDAMTDALLVQIQQNPAVGLVPLRNQAYVAHGGASTLFTAPATVIFLALGGGTSTTSGAASFGVKARTTGVFYGSINFSWNDTAGGAGDTITWTLCSVTLAGASTAGTVFTGAANPGAIGMGVYLGGASSTLGIGGLATTTLATVSTLFVGIDLASTSIGGHDFSWSGLIYPLGASGTIFTPPAGALQGAAAPFGNVVGLTMAVNAAGTIQIKDISCFLQEWPWGAGTF